ncbi:MAG: DUF4402 domain-containing protein [Prolixibacteraceae bacterium]
MKKLFILFIAVAGFGVSSFAQSSRTATGTSGATIILPLTITAANPLEFGRIVPNGGGTVVISADGTTKTYNTVQHAPGGATPSAASFNVTGGTSAGFAISLVNNTFLLQTGAGGANETMSVTPVLSASSGTLSGANPGLASFTVGGTLTVGAAQASGVYTNSAGTFQVTVDYN